MPSKFNILSTLPNFITQDDKLGIIEYIAKEDYPLIADDKGNILHGMKAAQMFDARDTLG